MDGTRKKSVLVVGGGAVGAIAALNFEVGGLAEVTLVLRSNYNVVHTHGFDIKSCDHGSLQGWKPSIGMSIYKLACWFFPWFFTSYLSIRYLISMRPSV